MKNFAARLMQGVARGLFSLWMSGVIGLGAILVLGWLIYHNVVAVLFSEVPLPPGVGVESAPLHVSQFEQVNDQRVQRVRATPLPFRDLASPLR